MAVQSSYHRELLHPGFSYGNGEDLELMFVQEIQIFSPLKGHFRRHHQDTARRLHSRLRAKPDFYQFIMFSPRFNGWLYQDIQLFPQTGWQLTMREEVCIRLSQTRDSPVTLCFHGEEICRILKASERSFHPDRVIGSTARRLP